ncbi:MAG: hypothetical protein AB7T49_04115 [Oligoflexales bacterium]
MRKMIIQSLVIVLSLLSCKSRQSSNVKYGALKEGVAPSSAWLMKIPPGGEINACGNRREVIERSLKRWAQVIGRDKNLKIGNNEKCSFPIASDYGQIEGIAHNDPRPTVCRTGDGAVSKSYFGTLWETRFCSEIDGEEENYAVLHEVGHAWGMCDQYDKTGTAIGMHPTCDPGYSSQQAVDSVMSGARTSTDLTPDDILGLRILACRADISANVKWAEKLKSEILTWEGVKEEAIRLTQAAGRDLFIPICLGQTTPVAPATTSNVPSPIPDLQWAPGQPDDTNHTQNCVAMSEEGLIDADCSEQFNFICYNPTDWVFFSGPGYPWANGHKKCDDGSTFRIPKNAEEAKRLKEIADEWPDWINLTDEAQEGVYISVPK